jgi:hypothetical protein
MSTIIPRILKGFSIFAVVVGTADAFVGARLLPGFSTMDPESPTTAWVDSQVRFLGAMFGAVGGVMWWASNDMRQRKASLQIIMAAIVCGGVGRAMSGMTFGFHGWFLQTATYVELIGPALFYLATRS